MRRAGVLAALALALAGRTALAEDVPLLPGAEGLTRTLHELGQGGRPVVAHFFATWCVACVDEMPTLRDVVAQARAAGAVVVFFSLDRPEAHRGKIAKFLHDQKLAVPAYVLDAPEPEPITAVIDSSWNGALPATFVFKSGNRIAAFHGPLGGASALDEALRAAGKAAAATPPQSSTPPASPLPR